MRCVRTQRSRATSAADKCRAECRGRDVEWICARKVTLCTELLKDRHQLGEMLFGCDDEFNFGCERSRSSSREKKSRNVALRIFLSLENVALQKMDHLIEGKRPSTGFINKLFSPLMDFHRGKLFSSSPFSELINFNTNSRGTDSRGKKHSNNKEAQKHFARALTAEVICYQLSLSRRFAVLPAISGSRRVSAKQKATKRGALWPAAWNTAFSNK